MREKNERQTGQISANTGRFLLLITFCYFFLLPPTQAQQADSSTNPPQQNAYLFNMTTYQIVDLVINDIPTGIHIPPAAPVPPWAIGPPQELWAPGLHGAALSVVFENGATWTQTVSTRPRSGGKASNIAIWLFYNGMIVSDEQGSLHQMAWAQAVPLRQ